MGDFIQNMLQGFLKFFESAINTVVVEILQAIIDMLTPMLVDFFAVMTESVQKVLTMSLTQFVTIFPVATQIRQYLITLGVAFTVGLFLIGLTRNMFSGLGFQAQSPYKMSIRFLMAIFLCVFSSNLFEYIFTGMFGIPYGALMNMTTDTINWNALQAKNINTAFQGVLNFLKTPIDSDSGRLLASILVLALMLMLVYNFLILVVEMFERYLMVNILIVFSPLASSSIVLESTQNIFKSFCRMFFGQNLLLLCNAITLCMVNTSVGYFSRSVVGSQDARKVIVTALMIVAFLKIAQHFDNYLRDLGLSVGISGGNMIAEIVMSVKALHNVMSKVSGVAKGAVKSGAKVAGTSGGNPGMLGGSGFHFAPPTFGGAARGPKPAGPSGFGGGEAFAKGFSHAAASSPIYTSTGSSAATKAASFMSGKAAADTMRGVKDVGQAAAGAVSNINEKASSVNAVNNPNAISRKAAGMNPANNPNIISGMPFNQDAAVGAFNQMPNKQTFNTGNTAKMQAMSTIGAPALGNRFAPSGMNLNSIKSTGNGALVKDNAGNLHMFSQTNPLSMPSFQNMQTESLTGSDGNTYYHSNVNEMSEPMQAYMNASYDAGQGSLDAGEVQQSIDSYQAFNSPAESVKMSSGDYQETPFESQDNNESIPSGAYQNLSEEPSVYQGIQAPSGQESFSGVQGSIPNESSLPSMPAPHEGENKIPSKSSSASPVPNNNPLPNPTLQKK